VYYLKTPLILRQMPMLSVSPADKIVTRHFMVIMYWQGSLMKWWMLTTSFHVEYGVVRPKNVVIKQVHMSSLSNK